jgi:hypothetical protein
MLKTYARNGGVQIHGGVTIEARHTLPTVEAMSEECVRISGYK